MYGMGEMPGTVPDRPAVAVPVYPARERRCCRQPESGCATWGGRPTPGRRPPEGRCQPAARAAGVQLVVAHPLRDYIVCRTRNNAYAGVWPWGGHSYVNTSGLNFRRFVMPQRRRSLRARYVISALQEVRRK